MQPTPSVSVVIPTRNRPEMVVAAVRSALAQTRPPLEVVVIIDGPEHAPEASRKALAAVNDPRLRVLPLAESRGGSAARNLGVNAACGEWIAFLDDDDLWLPRKLEAQMALRQTLPVAAEVVLSCAVVARSPDAEEVWPRTRYRAGQPVDAYLFCRRGWRYGEALLQTSTLMTTRTLLQRVPFDEKLAKHQDWDWLLRVSAGGGVSIHAAEGAPLAVFHIGGARESVGRSANWRFSLAWALERRGLFTPDALAGFLATECAAQAARQGWRERLACLAAILPLVSSSRRAFVRMLAFLFTTQSLRRRALARRRSRLSRQTYKAVAAASVESSWGREEDSSYP